MTELPQNLADLLGARHAPLSQALAGVQYALLDRQPEVARDRLRALSLALRAHIRVEDSTLIPAYERLVSEPTRGAGAEVFRLEHSKILRMLVELDEALCEAGLGVVPHRAALSLLEQVHPLKAVLHHHEEREERLLAPALQTALGAAAAAFAETLRATFDGVDP